MPKLLIISPTLVNYKDDRGGVAHDSGEVIDAPQDVAKVLIRTNRALYVNKTDDPDKAGINTAPADLVTAAKAAVKAKGKPKTGDGGQDDSGSDGEGQ